MNRLKKKIIISLMGVDGAGKTTLAKKLNKVFKNSKYLHLKPYILFKDRRTVI
jgi:uridine kinase